MVGASYRVDGGRELRAALTRMGIDVENFRDVHHKVGSFVGATAAQRAPRRSGMLAASWRPGAAKTQATVRFGSALVPYANAMHWGTGARAGKRGPHNIPRNPFAWNAARDTEPTWTEWYLDALQHLADIAMEKAS